jgi:hypothetical protein
VPVTIPTFDDDLEIIQKLDDEPNDVGGLTPAELKAKFDEGNVTAQRYINEVLIPVVVANDLTEQDREAAESERVTNEIERVGNEAQRVTAEQERADSNTTIRNLVENMEVSAETLTPGSSATAQISVDGQTGGYKISLGIPKGESGSGTGDMTKSVYDPTGKAVDVFKYANDAIGTHNVSTAAHSDIRQLIANKKGAQVYTATIGTNWTEDSDTGVKTQTVSISGVTADSTAKIDHGRTVANNSDDLALYVEEENQYLTYVTNGYAETVSGGVKFTIFGDPNTVAIPIVVEVV